MPVSGTGDFRPAPCGDTPSSGRNPDGTFARGNTSSLTHGGRSRQVGSAIFSLTQPTITLSPTTATMGVVVTITGAGWVPLSTVFITMDSNYLEVASSAATADVTGGFETTMKLPSAVGIGSKVVSFDAADISYLGNTAITQDLTVPAPNVTLSATEAAVGSIVTLEASGFTPHSALTDLSIGGLDVWEGVPITDSIGSLTVPFKVPGLIGGQLVLVSIGGTTISKALIVKNTIVPPLPQPTPQPALATPAVEVFADLIANGNNLIRVFRFDNSTQTWEFFDPRPEFAAANNLTTTVAGEIVWVNVSSGQEFQGQTLVAGWNLFSLK